MCGIFGYLRLKQTSHCDEVKKTDCSKARCRCDEKVTKNMVYSASEKLSLRGPDRSTFHEISEYGHALYLGFHRLSIMDPSTDGDQPFKLEHKKYNEIGELIEHRSIYAICNGEIYNYTELVAEHSYGDKMRGHSDCEFLPYFYADHGIEKLVEDIRAEAAIAIIDIDRITKVITLHLARDTGSVRPLFIGMDARGFGFASELKGLYDIIEEDKIRQLRGGRRYEVSIDVESDSITFDEHMFFDLNKYSHEYIIDELHQDDVFEKIKYNYEIMEMLKLIYPDTDTCHYSSKDRIFELNSILTSVRETFERCVVSVLESDVPIGALLSGGLDSSLCVSIAAKELRKHGKCLRTFSVGIPGAVDKIFAEMVSSEVGSHHTHVEFTNDEFIDAIPHVIRAIESYDITSVRASTGQWLISKWIRDNTDIKVLLIGDGSDELCSGYLYNHAKVDPILIHNDSISRLSDIGFYDALRSDRGIASNGIEARTPFLHRDFVETYIKIDPRLKVPLGDNCIIEHDTSHFVDDINSHNTIDVRNDIVSSQHYVRKTVKRIEKWLLRKAFDVKYEDYDGSTRSYLPEKVLWRIKEGLSDGCSSKEKSWYKIIQESVENMYSQDDIDRWVEILSTSDTKCSPWTKEAVHYLEIFTQYYGRSYQVIPYYWMPSFSKDVKDPSARVLSVYE